jgi:endonuclease G
MLFSVPSWANDLLPTCPKHNGELVKHRYYTLCYGEEHEQAQWTYHELTPQMLKGSTKRTDNFREDPKVSTRSADDDDYRGSGFDRGHLVPAGDMKVNKTAMSESFYMSNMSPQRPGFNRGIWKKLEGKIRYLAKKEKKLIVITGPVLERFLPTLYSGVSIPEYYYKIIYSPAQKGAKMLAFLMPNAYSKRSLKSFVVTVDEIERLTGLNFFKQLPDHLEKKLESSLNTNQWPKL